jgi:carbohydrate-selective porin OprB
MELRIFKYFGDQVEVEHAHTLFGEPGKVRLLAWRDRANIASFQDALNYLNNNPGADPQAIFAVRSDKIKYGYGINVEQAINKDLGFFLRAMQTDGKTETLAFVESDASIGTGFSLKGTSWQRPKDTVGLGYLYNTISDDRRRYLEAGGISYFIGDGHLNYRPEQTFEVYYSANVYKDFNITADYQHMQNPAYNADRGPVDFVALRVHVDF